jgi:hypothetical protein
VKATGNNSIESITTASCLMPSTASVLKSISFHPNIDFVAEDEKIRRRLKTVVSA